MAENINMPRRKINIEEEMRKLKWLPIESYDGSDAMLRSATRCVFGCRDSAESFVLIRNQVVQAANDTRKVWGELLDGDFMPLPEFSPTEWARASRDLAAAMMMH